jgi:hypothetical protein
MLFLFPCLQSHSPNHLNAKVWYSCMHSNRFPMVDSSNRVWLVLVEQEYDRTSSSCECVDVILDMRLSNHSDLTSVNVHLVLHAIHLSTQ